MDPVTLLLIAGGAAATPVLAWLALRSERRAAARAAEQWARTASELGLEFEIEQKRDERGPFNPAGPCPRLVGARGDFGLTCGVCEAEDVDDASYNTFVEVALPRELGVGLRLSRRSSRDTSAGRAEVLTGLETIDRVFAIHADDPDRAALLLATRYVADGLIVFSKSRFLLTVEDQRIRLETLGRHRDTATLAPTIDSAVALGQRLLAAREERGEAPYDAQVGALMQRVARSLSFEHEAGQLAVRGRLEGVTVEAYFTKSDGVRGTEFVARFDRALELQLSLTKQTWGAIGELLSGQDIDTGDPSFDARFLIKGAPEAAVRAALTPEVRRRLLELQDTAEELRAQDDRVVARVGYPILEPEALERGLRAMAKLGAALGRVPSKLMGPFRS